MWRWGCRLGKGRSNTHALCPPGSHAKRDRSDACIWGAAPGRHTDELMKCYAVRLAGVGMWRVWGEGIPAINHPRWSWDPLLPNQPDRGEEHGAKATLKALSVPRQHERVEMESKKRDQGDNNQEVWCRVTGEVQLSVETKWGVETGAAEGHSWRRAACETWRHRQRWNNDIVRTPAYSSDLSPWTHHLWSHVV